MGSDRKGGPIQTILNSVRHSTGSDQKGAPIQTIFNSVCHWASNLIQISQKPQIVSWTDGETNL